MFDVGFWEVAIIGVIALLVVGPDRLPALARNVGLWVGRIRRYVTHVKQDIEREIHAEEVRELINSPESIKKSLGGGLSDLEDMARETTSAVRDLKDGIDDAARAGSAQLDGGEDATAADSTAAPSESAPTPSAPAVAHHAVDDDPFASPTGTVEARSESAGTETTTASEEHEQALTSQRRD